MSELQKIDTVVGDGKEAAAGNHVDVHYTGWLFDEKAADHKGQKFDSSLDRGQLFSFPLGAGHVIKGWDEGVAGKHLPVLGDAAGHVQFQAGGMALVRRGQKRPEPIPVFTEMTSVNPNFVLPHSMLLSGPPLGRQSTPVAA